MNVSWEERGPGMLCGRWLRSRVGRGISGGLLTAPRRNPCHLGRTCSETDLRKIEARTPQRGKQSESDFCSYRFKFHIKTLLKKDFLLRKACFSYAIIILSITLFLWKFQTWKMAFLICPFPSSLLFLKEITECFYFYDCLVWMYSLHFLGYIFPIIKQFRKMRAKQNWI